MTYVDAFLGTLAAATMTVLLSCLAYLMLPYGSPWYLAPLSVIAVAATLATIAGVVWKVFG